MTWNRLHEAALNPAFWTSVIIASGALGCVLAGGWSRRFGSRAVAEKMLVISGGCCILSPLMMSAQFSALSTRTAPPEVVGSVLTLIQCLWLCHYRLGGGAGCCNDKGSSVKWLAWCLLPGPLLGIMSLRGLKERYQTDLV